MRCILIYEDLNYLSDGGGTKVEYVNENDVITTVNELKEELGGNFGSF